MNINGLLKAAEKNKSIPTQKRFSLEFSPAKKIPKPQVDPNAIRALIEKKEREKQHERANLISKAVQSTKRDEVNYKDRHGLRKAEQERTEKCKKQWQKVQKERRDFIEHMNKSADKRDSQKQARDANQVLKSVKQKDANSSKRKRKYESFVGSTESAKKVKYTPIAAPKVTDINELMKMAQKNAQEKSFGAIVNPLKEIERKQPVVQERLLTQAERKRLEEQEAFSKKRDVSSIARIPKVGQSTDSNESSKHKKRDEKDNRREPTKSNKDKGVSKEKPHTGLSSSSSSSSSSNNNHHHHHPSSSSTSNSSTSTSSSSSSSSTSTSNTNASSSHCSNSAGKEKQEKLKEKKHSSDKDKHRSSHNGSQSSKTNNGSPKYLVSQSTSSSSSTAARKPSLVSTVPNGNLGKAQNGNVAVQSMSSSAKEKLREEMAKKLAQLQKERQAEEEEERRKRLQAKKARAAEEAALKKKLKALQQNRSRLDYEDEDDLEENLDEYEDDFIDDGPIDDPYAKGYSEHIREIFKYDKSKYLGIEDDDIEESSFTRCMAEEARSARLGREEDLEDMRKEAEDIRRKNSRSKTLKDLSEKLKQKKKLTLCPI